ncbi:hypothetical protein F53441_5636 [Fusarium austroafricanum]|uniref:DUF7598 domain-containing protein n=1 Tax=Fusarium austroafricanum TaxID=2364996 RepID=A0A8H4KJN8_9HYPO|nr:hypothetical protein F53441_5636 [Fusarium austroafricanum]
MFGQRVWGPGMIFLQILRVLTIISLLTAGAAYWVLIIKINTSKGWFFFEILSHAIMSLISICLIISELPFWRSFFANHWPVFSDEHGLCWLGVGLLLVGTNLLGNLNSPYHASDEMGLPFWRLVLASGILTCTFGVLNLISTLIFRGKNVNARKIRANGSLADEESFGKPHSNYSASLTNSERPKKTFMSFFWNRNRGGGSTATRPHISQPIARERDLERNAPPHYEQHHEPAYGSRPSHDSEEDRRSPIVPEVRRPDTALHPMNIRPHSPSMYSEAHMSRF